MAVSPSAELSSLEAERMEIQLWYQNNYSHYTHTFCFLSLSHCLDCFNCNSIYPVTHTHTPSLFSPSTRFNPHLSQGPYIRIPQRNVQRDSHPRQVPRRDPDLHRHSTHSDVPHEAVVPEGSPGYEERWRWSFDEWWFELLSIQYLFTRLNFSFFLFFLSLFFPHVSLILRPRRAGVLRACCRHPRAGRTHRCRHHSGPA